MSPTHAKPSLEAAGQPSAPPGLMRRFHEDQGGQAIVFIAMIALLLSLFAVVVLNTGNFVHHRIENQNSADATAYTGARWVARGMNGIAATNATASTFFSFILISHGIVGLQTSAQIVNSISKGIAQGVKAIPIVGAVIGGVLDAARIPADLMLKANQKLGKLAKKLIDGLWTGMRVLNGISQAFYYGTPLIATLESARVAKADGSDFGILVNYDRVIPTLPLRNYDDAGKYFFSDADPETPDLCTMAKKGNPGRDLTNLNTCPEVLDHDYSQPFGMLNPEGEGLFSTGAVTNPRGDGTIAYFTPFPDYSKPGSPETRTGSTSHGQSTTPPSIAEEAQEGYLFGCSWELINYRQIAALEALVSIISQVAGPALSPKVIGNPFYIAYYIIGGLWGLAVEVLKSMAFNIIDLVAFGFLEPLGRAVKKAIEKALYPFQGLPTKAFEFYHREILNSIRDYCKPSEDGENEGPPEQETTPTITLTDYNLCRWYAGMSTDDGRPPFDGDTTDQGDITWTGFRSYCQEFEFDTTFYAYDFDAATQRGWGNGEDDTLWGPKQFYADPEGGDFSCADSSADYCVDGRPAILINTGSYRAVVPEQDVFCQDIGGETVCMNCTTRADGTRTCRSDCFAAGNVPPCFDDGSAVNPSPRGTDCSFMYPPDSSGEVNDVIDLDSKPPLYKMPENFWDLIFSPNTPVPVESGDPAPFNWQRTYNDDFDPADESSIPDRPQVNADACLAQQSFDEAACVSACGGDPDCIDGCEPDPEACQPLGWRSSYVYRIWSCENAWAGRGGSDTCCKEDSCCNCEPASECKDIFDNCVIPDKKWFCCYNEGISNSDRGGFDTIYRVDTVFVSCDVPISMIEVNTCVGAEIEDNDDPEDIPISCDTDEDKALCAAKGGTCTTANYSDTEEGDAGEDSGDAEAAKSCQGGTNDGTECTGDGDCEGGGTCQEEAEDPGVGTGIPEKEPRTCTGKGSHLLGHYWPRKCPKYHPYLLLDDEGVVEARLNLLAMAFRDRRKGHFRNENGLANFKHSLPFMDLAQARVFNPTENSSWSQDWDARLAPVGNPDSEASFQIPPPGVHFFH